MSDGWRVTLVSDGWGMTLVWHVAWMGSDTSVTWGMDGE